MNDTKEFITLKELRRTISALEDSLAKVEAAKKSFEEIPETMRDGTDYPKFLVTGCIHHIKEFIKRHKEQLELQEHEVYNYEGCILQAPFVYKKFRYRLIVNKPDKRCDEPYLDNLQWQALLLLFGKETVDIEQIRVDKKFAVAVMSKGGYLIERMIPPLNPPERKI